MRVRHNLGISKLPHRLNEAKVDEMIAYLESVNTN